MQETGVPSLGHRDPLEEEMATHSSILAWRVPWTEGPGELHRSGVTESRTQLRDRAQTIISSVQSLRRVQLFATPWTAARQAALSITSSRSPPKLMSTESVMPSNISSSVVPFSSHLQCFPASRSFPVSRFFASCGQSIGVSTLASVLPVNTQD